MTLPFVFRILFLLFLIGGAIAYIGNYVGRLIGKKRLTIFNLRPRYTAIFIAVISGILIALVTFVLLLLISQDARTALLGLEKLKAEIKIKEEELKVSNKKLDEYNLALQRMSLQEKELAEKLRKAKVQIVQLQALREKLGQEVKLAREGQILFRVGEVILQSLIQAGPEREKVETGLKQVLSAADAYVRSLGVKSEKHLIFILPEDFDQTLYSLLGERKVFVVKLVAKSNVLWGEEIPVRFELVENRLVYKKGEVIAEKDISSFLSATEIEQEIIGLLREVRARAIADGMLPDPTGAFGSVSYAKIFELAKRIKSSGRKVNLKIAAESDIYVVGPLEIKFVFGFK